MASAGVLSRVPRAGQQLGRARRQIGLQERGKTSLKVCDPYNIAHYGIDKLINTAHDITVSAEFQIGDRVYLRICVAGDPGCIVGWNKRGRAIVEWYDLPELGRNTVHDKDMLILDESFTVSQREFSFDFGEMAA
jgi:hypothetical protein